MVAANRKLRVYLCHAQQDKPAARKLYDRLLAESWIDPWLDEKKLKTGDDWTIEMEKAIEQADAVLVFLSRVSVMKEGFFQKEIKYAIDLAEEKPEGAIYVIPVRVDDADVPRRLRLLQWVDLFEKNGQSLLVESLRRRANSLGIEFGEKGNLQEKFSSTNRPLRVFLGHASQDKPEVRNLYRQLSKTGWIDPWLDEEKILPGQNWNGEIEKAIWSSDAVIACFSKNSTNKEGYIKQELQTILSVTNTRSKNFVIPLRLEDCDVPLEWGMEYIDLFPRTYENRAFELLLAKLEIRAKNLNLGLVIDIGFNSSIPPVKKKTISKARVQPKQKSKKLFISYSRKNLKFVGTLASDLEAVGLSIWWDVSGLQGGNRWKRAIQAAIDDCSYCVVILSPDSIKSNWVENEYTYALKKNKVVIPLYLLPCEIPIDLVTIQYIDFFENSYGVAVHHLLTALGK